MLLTPHTVAEVLHINISQVICSS